MTTIAQKYEISRLLCPFLRPRKMSSLLNTYPENDAILNYIMSMTTPEILLIVHVLENCLFPML